MLANLPMFNADAGAFEEPAHGEREQCRDFMPPPLGGESVLAISCGHGRAPGCGPHRAARSPFT